MASVNDISIRLRVEGKEVETSLASLKKHLGDLDKDSKKSGDSLGGMFTKMKMGYLAIAAAVGGVVAAINSSINAASNLEEVQNKFDVVFKGMEDRAEQMAKNLQDNYLMSERAAKQYLSSVQDLLVPMGMNREAAADMSEAVVQLSADLGSFNNLPTEQVMGDIQSALVGNFETMKKYGVVLNETRVKQEAMNRGMWDGKGVIDASVRAHVAYQLITQDSAAAIGDVARSSDSYANTQKELAARFEDLQAAIGTIFMPVAKTLLEMTIALVEAFTELVGWASSLAEKWIGNARALNEFRKQIQGLSEDELNRKLIEINTQMDVYAEKIKEFRPTVWDEIVKGIGAATGNFGMMGGELGQLLGNYHHLEERQKALNEELKKYKLHIDGIPASIDNSVLSQNELNNAIERYASLLQLEAEERLDSEARQVESRRQFFEYLSEIEDGWLDEKQQKYYDSMEEQAVADEEALELKYELGLSDYNQYVSFLNMKLTAAMQVYGKDSVEYLKLVQRKRKLDEDLERNKRFNQAASFRASMAEMASLVEAYRGTNRTIFNIAKGAAYATAIINTFQGVTKTIAEYAFPWSLIMAAAQLALGLASVAKISSTSYNYDRGGFTGFGARKEPAGIVHRGEVVFNQDDVRAWGGPGNVERIRTRSFDTGGVVGDMLASVPVGNANLENRLANLEDTMRDLKLTAELDAEHLAIVVEAGNKHLIRRTF